MGEERDDWSLTDVPTSSAYPLPLSYRSHLSTPTSACRWRPHTHTHTHTRARARAHTCTLRAHARTHTHAHTRTHTQAVSRKLYRFLRRAFAQWPLTSSSSLVPTLHLWLSIITPWAAGSATTATVGTTAPSPEPPSATDPYGASHGQRLEGVAHLLAGASQRLHLPGSDGKQGVSAVWSHG